MVNYYTTLDGEISVKNFISEGKPVTCYSNLLLGTPASFSCEFLENTTLITLKYRDLKKLYASHLCWERLGRLSAEQIFIDKEQREFEFLTLDAKSRYRNFCKNEASVLNRVPQYLIASYIGITPVALSRLRAKSI